LTFLFPHFLLILFNSDFRAIVTCTYLQLGSRSLLFYHFPFRWNARHKTWHRLSFRSERRGITWDRIGTVFMPFYVKYSIY